MIVHQEWGEVGRRHMQLPCCTSKSGGGGPGSRTFYFLAFFGTWKQQLLAFLCGNGFLFQVMVNQYYVVYRNILQSIVPAVIVLFIGDHYWSLIHFSNLITSHRHLLLHPIFRQIWTSIPLRKNYSLKSRWIIPSFNIDNKASDCSPNDYIFENMILKLLFPTTLCLFSLSLSQSSLSFSIYLNIFIFLSL